MKVPKKKKEPDTKIVVSKSVLPSKLDASLLNPDQEVKVVTKAHTFKTEEDPEEEPKGRSGLGYENMLAVVEITKDGPWWTQKEFVKDSEGRRPDHADYD